MVLADTKVTPMNATHKDLIVRKKLLLSMVKKGLCLFLRKRTMTSASEMKHIIQLILSLFFPSLALLLMLLFVFQQNPSHDQLKLLVLELECWLEKFLGEGGKWVPKDEVK